MTTPHASQQAASFMNRLKSIAIVGANGTIGSHILSALLAKKRFNITAITRVQSSATFAQDINVARVDYDKPDTIVSALKNHDALIITMSVTAARDTQAKLIRAAADAGVPWVLPNEFGMFNTEEAQNDTLGNSKGVDRDLIESLGLSWIGVTCGFWYEWSLSGPGLYGIDIGKREVVFFDDGNTKLNTSTWAQTVHAVAAILSLPVLPEDDKDESLTLTSYRNRMLFVKSFAVSQREMFDALKRVTATTDSDWNISSVSAKQRFAKAKEDTKGGNRVAFATQLYTRYFIDDAGLFEKNHALENEKLGLPVEDLNEATKLAVELQKSGWWNNKMQ
jgi:NAD(P)-dependent dehydrogenase (short-subunit alcohol dehydrogenase family)